MVLGYLFLVYINLLLFLTFASPIEHRVEKRFNAKSERSWLWGWAWGTESTVSIVDRIPAVSFPSRPAAFGAEISDPLLGYVIPLSSFTAPCKALGNETLLSSRTDNSGCPDLCLTRDFEPTETWIALVQRGKCEFVKKVREAQRLGAKAVVVGGEDPDTSGFPDTLVNMYSPEDSSDIRIAATYIKYSDYMQLSSLIHTSNTTHSGLRTLSLLITAEYSAWEWYSPIITLIIILLLPSALTFITLLIHRIRAARAAQRDRAPEDVVRNLPWRVWTGTGWEKHEGGEDANSVPDHVPHADDDIEACLPTKDSNSSASSPNSTRASVPTHSPPATETETETEEASTSIPPPIQPENLPWFESQLECAICLCEFAKGDKVRVLPCHHIFHLHEVDEWLIQRKKLCPVCKADVTQPPPPPPIRSYTNPSDDPNHVPPQPTLMNDATEQTPLLTTTTSNASNASEEHN